MVSDIAVVCLFVFLIISLVGLSHIRIDDSSFCHGYEQQSCVIVWEKMS